VLRDVARLGVLVWYLVVLSSCRLVVSSSRPNSAPLFSSPPSAQLVRCLFDVEDGARRVLLHTLVPDHSIQLLVCDAHCSVLVHTSSRCAHLRPRPGWTLWGFWRREQSGCRSAGSIRRYPSFSKCTNVPHRLCADTHASSNSRASLRNAFLHFLHIKVMSNVCISGWSACSAWHSAQSNHFLPGCHEPSFCSKHCGGPTAWRADGHLGVEDVFAAARVSAAEVMRGSLCLWSKLRECLPHGWGGDGEVSLACGPNRLTMLGSVLGGLFRRVAIR
jgi:hypothetical protein